MLLHWPRALHSFPLQLLSSYPFLVGLLFALPFSLLLFPLLALSLCFIYETQHLAEKERATPTAFWLLQKLLAALLRRRRMPGLLLACCCWCFTTPSKLKLLHSVRHSASHALLCPHRAGVQFNARHLINCPAEGRRSFNEMTQPQPQPESESIHRWRQAEIHSQSPNKE